MALADVVCRIAFDSSPIAAGQWVLGRSELGIDTRLGYYDAAIWDDVSDDVREITINRGRQHELDQIRAGTCIVVLDNRSGDYWPNNAAGPYYPNIIPDKRINIRAVYDGVTYDRYTGYIESWTPGYLQDGDNSVPIVTIVATDIYEFLARTPIDDAGGYAQELSGVRVKNILDDMGFPEAARDLDAGQTTLIATGALDGAIGLSQLRLVQDSELGLALQGPDGVFLFQERTARLKAPLKTARAMFGDGIALDVGGGATNRGAAFVSGFTVIDVANPVNADGVITRVELWANTNLTGVEVAMFYNIVGAVYSTRSVATIGAVVAGSVQSFDVELPCQAGDYIGMYWAAGNMELDMAGGAGIMGIAGDQIPGYGVTYGLLAARQLSIAGIGKISRVRRFELELSRTLIYNDVRITREGGAEQTSTDGDSAADHGYKLFEKTGLAMTTDAIAQDMADWILATHKDSPLRVKSIMLTPETEPDDLWPKVLEYDISDKIYVKKADADIDQAFHIEGIQDSYNANRGTWWTQWWLSDADTQGAWILGESALGLETVLAFGG